MSATTESFNSLQLQSQRAVRVRSLWGDAWRRFIKNRLAVGGLVIIIIFFVTAAIGPVLAPYDFQAQNYDRQLESPSRDYWLGTDDLGRDIFSRLLYGTRTAAIVAVVSTVVSLIIGIIIGATAGYSRGRTDEFLMWLTDTTMAVPGLLLAMVINAALKRPIINWLDAMYLQTKNPIYQNTLWLDFVLIFGILALISWPGLARLIRGQVLSIGNTTYVEAARSIGATPPRILARHVVPNSLGPLIVTVTAGMGGAVVLESALSWLGLGVQPPNASWGVMLNNSQSFWRSYPYLLISPAVTIGIISVAFTFFGDGLNDALNPRLQQK
ncbi:ABC transporter permease [Chloroflexi bacterium TSY]|nr:ABC transporter permease [Chloroflexi bacterium TSY]